MANLFFCFCLFDYPTLTERAYRSCGQLVAVTRYIDPLCFCCQATPSGCNNEIMTTAEFHMETRFGWMDQSIRHLLKLYMKSDQKSRQDRLFALKVKNPLNITLKNHFLSHLVNTFT